MQVLQVLTAMLVAAAFALPLAHALEWPGKRRLDRQTYESVQPIYYPGFTVGGMIGEFGGIIATAVLLLMTSRQSAGFWLILAAAVALLAMHATYWLLAHPVNEFWLREQRLKGAGRSFFSFDPFARSGRPPNDWEAARNRWELAHAVRAALAAIALLAVVTSIAIE